MPCSEIERRISRIFLITVKWEGHSKRPPPYPSFHPSINIAMLHYFIYVIIMKGP